MKTKKKSVKKREPEVASPPQISEEIQIGFYLCCLRIKDVQDTSTASKLKAEFKNIMKNSEELFSKDALGKAKFIHESIYEKLNGNRD